MGIKIDGKQVLFGIPGPQGPQGKPGENGVGVPTGGSSGQILSKKTNDDYDTQWVNQPSPYILPIASNSVLGGIKTNSSRNGITVNSDGVAHVNAHVNTSINTNVIALSSNGDDSTANGTSAKPFATLGAAVNYLNKTLVDKNVTFWLPNSGNFIINEEIVFDGLNIAFESRATGSSYSLAKNLYFNNCNLIFEGCTIDFATIDGTGTMYINGNTTITLGTFYYTVFRSSSTGITSCFTTFGSDFNSKWTFSPFIAATMYRFELGSGLELITQKTYVNQSIVMVKNCGQTTIGVDSYIYNGNTLDSGHKIGNSNVYVY